MSGLSGNQKRALRSAARFFAVQALFQMEQSDAPIGQIITEFADHRFGEEFEDYSMQEADLKVFRTLVNGAVDNQGSVDKMTDRALVAKWPIDRIDPTLRALFRVAGAELIVADTPPRVVIVEYVQIAQAFFPDGKESRFVNAVLDHMAREAKPEAF
ncbi:transcription antitermination factor NusB [Mangrovicoccus sp. HB161399]|uniref:transcription antitermination factor NusB n=1 Tax=Mangrovicoccus sp. HB161399 TaxID=2720392 RepID=UPI001554975D|nr:transcription antitermination factor NusB [Mangrovicoccus sp. HB161399]